MDFIFASLFFVYDAWVYSRLDHQGSFSEKLKMLNSVLDYKLLIRFTYREKNHYFNLIQRGGRVQSAAIHRSSSWGMGN
jgi:hypothetical protein